MEILTFLFSSLFFLIAFHMFFLFRKRELPPGPIGFPIVGNLFSIGPKPHESLGRLSKKYGPLMTVSLGNVTTIVASSAEIAKDILQKHDECFSGRTIPAAMEGLDQSDHAVAWISAGEEWRTIRRVLNLSLMNPQKLDTLKDHRLNAVGEMVDHVREVARRGGVVDVGKLAFTAALNQMSNVCFSENVAEFKGEGVNGFHSAVKTIMEIDVKFNVGDYFPWFKSLDPQGIRGKAKAAYGFLGELCHEFIRQRQVDRNSGLPRCGDVLDSFLDVTDKNDSHFTLKNIHVLLVELFLAGTETSSITTEWVMSELILNPSIMGKVRHEITKSIKAKGRIDEADILGLPYLQAVVKETMRLHLSVPLLLPHKTETLIKMNGFVIPKNTQVLVNAWAIARDVEYWDNPTVFMPERFLGSELDFKGQHFMFLPFGSGRRMCPGIPLAHRVVSLMVASLVYHFSWELPNSESAEELNMDDTFGLTLQRKTPLLVIPTKLGE